MSLVNSAQRGYAYHVVNITDLEKTLTEGIVYDDKASYDSKYVSFHSYFDDYKPYTIPEWVHRRKAIFASICFKEGHKWHAHSAILKVKISEDRCWVCNENLANFVYEPFVLQSIEGFSHVREFISMYGREYAERYWNNSLSYLDNLKEKSEDKEGYDAEILILHPIPPENIECLYIVSDHQVMSFKEWQEFFIAGNPEVENQYNRFLQPCNIPSASKTSGSL